MSTETIQRGDEDLSIRVVEAIAAATGTDPLAMDPPLGRVIDTDALDSLFRDQRWARVTFDYQGHEVVVGNDGSVTVDGERVSTGG